MSTIVTRAGKGAPLTHVEVDANFTNLNSDKTEGTVGTAPNHIPLNQYLGNMAYQDRAGVNITGGIVDVDAGTAALPSLGTTGDPDTGVFFPAANTIAVSTNGTERMRIASNGDVGIGTTSPVASLHVAGAIGAAPAGTGFMAGMQSNYAVAHLNGSDGGLLDFSVSGTDTRGRIIYTNSTNAMGFGTTDGVTKMTLDNTGNLLIGKTSATANGGDLQVSSGITFPATQVPKSDANTLDDYEEGTWTGTLTADTTAPITPVTATGTYTKIGRQVNVIISFVNANTTGALGTMRITGLPFTMSATPSYAVGTAGSFSTGANPMIARITASQTSIDFVQIIDVSSTIAINAGTPRFLFVDITYTV